MNCFYCGKPLRTDDGSGWHKACVKQFFGTGQLPEIRIDQKTLDFISHENVAKGFTVPGVQKKLSVDLCPEDGILAFAGGDCPYGYILKPPHDTLQALPEAEHLAMRMAADVGISTVPNALIRDGKTLAYITKRIDRVFTGTEVKKLAMEDFCQLDLRLSRDKYRGSYERCAKIIERYSSRKGLDLTELFMRLVFSFAVGNSDMHLKNFSLIETREASGDYVLSPAYDLLPVNIILSEDKEQFALPMNGKKTNLRRNDFLAFAKTCGIPGNAASNMIQRIVSAREKLVAACEESHLPPEMREAFIRLLSERIGTLDGTL